MFSSALRTAAIGLIVCVALARGGWFFLGAANTSGAPRADVATVESGGAQTVSIDGDLWGHFMVHPTIEGKRLTMMVDTGASFVALTYEDAAQAGITPRPGDYTQRFSTANGIVAAAPVRISEIRLGGITVRGVEATVMPRGAMNVSLLGMSFLRRLGGFEVQRGTLVLRG